MARSFTSKEFALTLRRWPGVSVRRLRASITEEMKTLARYIQQEFFTDSGTRSPSRIVNRTGRAQRSVRPLPTVVKRSGVIESGVRGGGNEARHFKFLEEGTQGPYVITPRRPGGVLRFETEQGDVIYTRRVVHPGIRPRAPLGRGVARRQTAIFQALAAEYGQELRRQFG